MKNANEQDAKKARETGVLEENVMYKDAGGNCVHGKKMSGGVTQCAKDKFGPNWIIAERADGELRLVNILSIQPILPKGPAQTPKKPRRTTVKGTRPERKIAVGHSTELKVGDIVELVDKSRHTIRSIDQGIARFFIKFDKGFWTIRENIKYLILPYKEEQKKHVTYSIGQKFVEKSSGDTFILAACSAEEVCLIAIDGYAPRVGNRWKSYASVQNPLAITQEEFERIAGFDAPFSLKQDEHFPILTRAF